MNNNSINNFVALCKKEITEDWKKNLLRVLLVCGVLFLASIAGSMKSLQYATPESNLHITLMDSVNKGVFLTFICIFGLLSASFTVEKLKTRTGRINQLMLPASNSSKFFSRWVIYTLLYLVIFIICFQLIDLVRVAIFSLFYTEVAHAPFNLFKVLETGAQNGPGLPVYITGYLFFQSIFVLGSSIWPKNSFLKTFASCFVVLLTFIIIVATYIKLTFNPANVHIDEPDINWRLYCFVFFTLFFIVNTLLAYYRFKETEIIN